MSEEKKIDKKPSSLWEKVIFIVVGIIVSTITTGTINKIKGTWSSINSVESIESTYLKISTFRKVVIIYDDTFDKVMSILRKNKIISSKIILDINDEIKANQKLLHQVISQKSDKSSD